ncbi:hypothetical protein [Streptomyces swartbergensis]|uniref:Uncharacterized protein n=1 Tax=Streptomyces swartbergensis TaxID=487165 RepID=A0A243S2F1_9ACTN|nr:hypothetical protein [Streptomyces swartbergensis]OUD01474.1 hypothetical protein CA983_19970 [Streptomyces swartbergensis]
MTPPVDTLEDRLSRWARVLDPRERAAVTALLEERTLLVRQDFRRLVIIDDQETGTACCDWALLCQNLYRNAIGAGDRAFLELVLSLACHHRTNLGGRLADLSRERQAIILRAIAGAAGDDTINVSPRL